MESLDIKIVSHIEDAEELKVGDRFMLASVIGIPERGTKAGRGTWVVPSEFLDVVLSCVPSATMDCSGCVFSCQGTPMCSALWCEREVFVVQKTGL